MLRAKISRKDKYFLPLTGSLGQVMRSGLLLSLNLCVLYYMLRL